MADSVFTLRLNYGANHFTVTVRKRNGNFSMTPTVHSCLVEPSSLSQNERGVANAQLGPYSYHCIIITAVCSVGATEVITSVYYPRAQASRIM